MTWPDAVAIAAVPLAIAIIVVAACWRDRRSAEIPSSGDDECQPFGWYTKEWTYRLPKRKRRKSKKGGK